MSMLSCGQKIDEIETDFGKITLRVPDTADTYILMDFVNSLITEEALIMLDKRQSLEEEVAYVTNAVLEISQDKRVHLIALLDDLVIGSCEVKREKGVCAHVGLLGISIRKEYRSKGLGKILMQKTLELSKDLGIEIVKLWIIGINTRAREFYKKQGFAECGTMPKGSKISDIYVDDVLMFLSLL